MAIFAGLNEKQIDWLTSKESLTKRLRAVTKDKISLHVLYDSWGITDENTEAWIRRVEWKYFNDTWISANIIIPDTSITEETSELINVGNRSIGDILFQDRSLTRSDFTFSKIENGWSRQSIFYFKKKPVLVVENFSLAFLTLITDH